MNKELHRTEENSVSLIEVLNLFESFSSSNNIYFIKNLKKTLKTANFLRDIKAPINLHYSFVLSPCKTKEYCLEYLKKYFKDFVELKRVEIPESLLVNKAKYSGRNVSPLEMIELQKIHNCIVY